MTSIPLYRSPVSTIVQLGLPTAGAIAPATFLQFLFISPDLRVRDGAFALQFPASLTQDFTSRPVRGRWRVSLVEKQDERTYRDVTTPIEVTDPKATAVRLGSTLARLTVGRSVYFRIDYEAASALAGEVVFWANATSVNLTINLE